MYCVPLMSASPSFASSTIGAILPREDSAVERAIAGCSSVP
jgi:hypothetical protein